MRAAVRTRVPFRPVGKDVLQSTNIPFLDSSPEAFSTSFQEDFQPISAKRSEPFHPAAAAQVDHKDVRYIKEYQTEAVASYQPHPLPHITRTKCWTKLCTNFKMQTDPKQCTFLTTQAQKFTPRPFQPPPAPIRPSQEIKKIKQVEKLPETTSKASFTAQRGAPVVRASVKHLEEGFPTIKRDGCHRSLVSEYKKNFKGVWSRVAQPVAKHTSSVAMGDPVKTVERESTHAASFSWPTICRPPVVKERLKINLGNFCKDPWSSTSRDDFCYRKPDPVVLTRRDRNSSFIPKEDTDTMRNKERMSVTTHSVSFSDLNYKVDPMNVPDPDLRTKSYIQFSPLHMSGLYYTTTANEHYGKPGGQRARPLIHQQIKILGGPDHGPSLSITKTDFLPVKTCRQTPYLPNQRSNISFPCADQHFSTTHGEEFTPKPLIRQRPVCKQSVSHLVMQ